MHGRTNQETKPSAKRRRTKRAPDAGESARFTGFFLASSFSLLTGRVHARPLAGNASRWHAPSMSNTYSKSLLL